MRPTCPGMNSSVAKIRLPWLCVAIVLMAQATIEISAQAIESKPKPTASISGRVTIGDKPAPGVTVAVVTSTPQLLLAQVISDPEGKYRLTGLPPGQVNVSAVAPTYVTPVSSGYVAGRVLNLSADETVEGIDFKLTRGGVITGKVTDADGKPVMNERIMLTAVNDKGQTSHLPQWRAANPYVYNTDDRGIYRIYGLPATRYKVSVGDNGGGATLRSGFYQKTYYPDTTDFAKATVVELGEAGEAKNIDITLGPRSRTYTVSGRVIDADTGGPVSGVSYIFGQIEEFQGRSMMSGYTNPSTPTNSKGEFRLEGVPPGRFAVTTVRNSFGMDPSQPKVYSDPVPFEITDSDLTDVELRVHRGLTISGVVLADAITNKAALAGVSRLIVSGVTTAPPSIIQTSSGFTTTPIAADGSFQLEGLRPGKVSIAIAGFSTAAARGYTITRITLNDREVTNRQIELAEGQSVSGVRIYLQFGTGVLKGEVKITGGTLAPESTIIVMLQAENQPRPVASAQVDSRGQFTMTGIPTGIYDAQLQVINFGITSILKPIHQSVSVTDGSEAQITFTLDLTRKEGP